MLKNLPLLAALFSSTVQAGAATELPERLAAMPEEERSVAYCEMVCLHDHLDVPTTGKVRSAHEG